MSRLFTGIVRPFESRDVAPLSVGGKTTKAADAEAPKTVTMIWGKGGGNVQVLNAHFTASVSLYMEKQQREKVGPTGGDTSGEGGGGGGGG